MQSRFIFPCKEGVEKPRHILLGKERLQDDTHAAEGRPGRSVEKTVFPRAGPVPHAADDSMRLRWGLSAYWAYVMAVTEMSVLSAVFRYIK